MSTPYTFTVTFDGGYGFRPGSMYGSWQIEFNGFIKLASRIPFRVSDGSMRESNNTAEYLALIGALRWLQTVKERQRYTVKIRGDSQLVVMQVRGRWRCHKPHLKMLASIARNHLNDFADWKIDWHRRDNSVAVFGH